MKEGHVLIFIKVTLERNNNYVLRQALIVFVV